MSLYPVAVCYNVRQNKTIGYSTYNVAQYKATQYNTITHTTQNNIQHSRQPSKRKITEKSRTHIKHY